MEFSTDPLNETDAPRGGVITIGNFDGLHRGHQELLAQVIDDAERRSVPSIVVTFDPHPASIVQPDRAPARILTLAQKRELIERAGIDVLLVVPFTHVTSRISAETFVREFVASKLNAVSVHVGEDFVFGAGRRGNAEMLRSIGEELGFETRLAPVVEIEGRKISSTWLREVIRSGEIELCRRMLGRDLFIDGRVVTGRRLGRKMGVPTVNLDSENELYPESGVFVTSSRFDTFGRTFQGITNIGVRPTLYENFARTIETHILDFHANVYGDQVRLFFHDRVRDEKQFASALELTTQIRRDIDAARSWFLTHPEGLPK